MKRKYSHIEVWHSVGHVKHFQRGENTLSHQCGSSPTKIAGRHSVAYIILKPDQSGYRTFDPPSRARCVAAWARNAAATVCHGWPYDPIERFVHGHGSNGLQLKGEHADRRFMYLPLPTINRALDRVEAIRRVLIAAPADCGAGRLRRTDRLDSPPAPRTRTRLERTHGWHLEHSSNQ